MVGENSAMTALACIPFQFQCLLTASTFCAMNDGGWGLEKCIPSTTNRQDPTKQLAEAEIAVCNMADCQWAKAYVDEALGHLVEFILAMVHCFPCLGLVTNS